MRLTGDQHRATRIAVVAEIENLKRIVEIEDEPDKVADYLRRIELLQEVSDWLLDAYGNGVELRKTAKSFVKGGVL